MIPALYCQRDKRWANVKMGSSNSTLGEYGCLATTVCNIACYTGHPCTPADVAGHVEWFDTIGDMILEKIDIPTLKFIKEEYGPITANVKAALANPNQFVALEISNPTVTKTHFVWAWSRTLFGDYKVGDPWTSQEVLASIYRNSIGPVTKALYFYRPV